MELKPKHVKDSQVEMIELVLPNDTNILKKQRERLNRVLRERDNAKVEDAKKMLYEAYKSKVNILPPLIEAVKTYITKGEIARVRGAVLGDQYGPTARDSDDCLLYLSTF